MSRYSWTRIAAIVLFVPGIVRAAITITPTTLPNWTVNAAYSETLKASGCLVACLWSSRGTLPAGLSLDSLSGTISGVPKATGSFTFTATASDALSSSAQQYTIVINSPPTITTAGLPGGQVNQPYSQTISVSNGTAPFKFSVISGSLPPGLSLDPTGGAIQGTPTAAASYNFRISVSDQAGVSASMAYVVVISAMAAPPIQITTTSLPGGTVGTAYSQTLAASGGTPPFSWSIVSGALPDGLTLDSMSAAITGTPSKAGSFTFTVRALDRASASAEASVSITVAVPAPAPTLSFNGMPDSSSSGQQIALDLVLSSQYSHSVSGNVTLTFQPDAAVSDDDPAIQFSGGGRTAAFTIPANATHAQFSVSPMALQTGTVSGTITLTVTSNLPNGGLTHSITVARTAPVIQSASISPNSGGFQIRIAGFSNSRELTNATFHFTASSGKIVQTSDLTISLSSLAGQWFTANGSAQFGGQVLIVVPFTVQQGGSSGLASVTVQLDNAQGPSPSVTANF